MIFFICKAENSIEREISLKKNFSSCSTDVLILNITPNSANTEE